MMSDEGSEVVECANGHLLASDASYCATCGAPRVGARQRAEVVAATAPASEVAVPNRAPSMRSTEPGDNQRRGRLRSWWSTTPRDERIRQVLMVSAITAVVIAVSVGTAVSGSGGDDPHTASTNSDPTPTPAGPAMFDPAASLAEVVHSIEHDFCKNSVNAEVVLDTLQITCVGTDQSGLGIAIFHVYHTSDAFQAALNSGAIPCSAGEQLVDGPLWYASTPSSDEAGWLVQQGGSSASCNTN